MGKTVSDPRRHLLEAGLKLFAGRGYAGTSVQEIIDVAGVAKPTLYYYFQNKAGLFQAIVDRALDERLQLMREAAPPGKETAEQLVDIIIAVSDFAARKPDALRLCFAIAFAAPGEFPDAFKKHDKMVETYMFLREIVTLGLKRRVLDASFSIDELTQSYFHLVQHSTAMSTFESKRRGERPLPLPPKMTPRRIVDLFIRGVAAKPALSSEKKKTRPAGALARAVATVAGLGFCLLSAYGDSTNNSTPSLPETNYPSADTAIAPQMTPSAPSAARAPAAGNSSDLADQRAVPNVVRASRPELALVSPIAENARDPRALDLQTCFQLTAVRDDSLKISLQDIRIAQAQLSQSIAGLWPTFTGSNQQQFIHYLGPTQGLSFTSFGTPVGSAVGTGGSGATGSGGTGGAGGTGGTGSTGGSTATGGSSGATVVATQGQRNYESQSTITMNYTIFNGGQNYNTVGASAALVAARRQTMARDYQTIFQDVAQAFYNVLQYEGDIAIQGDLVQALAARVDDLRSRVSLGRSRPSELLQAQTDLANARVTIQADVGSTNASLETLAFYTGVPSSKLKLKDTQKFPTVEQLEYYLGHSADRPDVLSDVESLRQSERNLSVARGELFPTVSANGNYLASQDPVSNNIDATMTLQISMPIFDGGLILGQIHQNKEMVRESALNVEQLKRTADQDTRTAYANFNASVAQVVVLREAAVLAAKNLAAQVEDYRRGVVSNLDVLTALQDYQTARQSLHNANMTARLDLINLHVAAGVAATGPNVNNQALPTTSGTGVAQ
jgi:outer membrane protein